MHPNFFSIPSNPNHSVPSLKHVLFFPVVNHVFFFLVTHDLDNKRAWAPCLRVEGVKLPTGYFIGASAATGKIKI